MLVTVGVVAVQSLLIVGLVYQRRARQSAESDSRTNLALAADASRRETMSALTSSIGHELGQPLGSMMHNAQALQMMVNAKRATSDTIEEILSDIQAQGARATQIIDRHRTMLKSHQLVKKPIDDLRGARAWAWMSDRISSIVSDVARFAVTIICSAWALCIIDPSG